MRASSLKVHSTTHTQGKSMNQRQLSNGSICIERVYKPPPCKKHTSSLNQDTSRVPTKRETEIFHRIKEEPSGKWLDRLTAHGRTAIRLLAVNHTESRCTTRHNLIEFQTRRARTVPRKRAIQHDTIELALWLMNSAPHVHRPLRLHYHKLNNKILKWRDVSTWTHTNRQTHTHTQTCTVNCTWPVIKFLCLNCGD